MDKQTHEQNTGASPVHSSASSFTSQTDKKGVQNKAIRKIREEIANVNEKLDIILMRLPDIIHDKKPTNRRAGRMMKTSSFTHKKKSSIDFDNEDE